MIQEVLDAKPVSLDNIPEIRDRICNSFFKNRKYPRYYNSTGLMLVSNGKSFGYHVFELDGCICVGVRAIIHKHCFYLVLPPMHKDGCLKTELSVIERLTKAGVATRLSDEDIELYRPHGLDIGSLRELTGQIEYVYEGMNWDKIKATPAFRKHRNAWNQAQSLNKTRQSGYGLQLLGRIKYHRQSWSILKKNKGQSVIDRRSMIGVPIDTKLDIKMTLEEVNSQLLFFDISEVVGLNRVVCTDRVSTHTRLCSEPKYYAHLAMLQRFEGCLINMGMAGDDPTLRFQKESLKPVARLQLWSTCSSFIDRWVYERLYENVQEEKSFIFKR